VRSVCRGKDFVLWNWIGDGRTVCVGRETGICRLGGAFGPARGTRPGCVGGDETRVCVGLPFRWLRVDQEVVCQEVNEEIKMCLVE
jgi:hypothetical protein